MEQPNAQINEKHCFGMLRMGDYGERETAQFFLDGSHETELKSNLPLYIATTAIMWSIDCAVGKEDYDSNVLTSEEHDSLILAEMHFWKAAIPTSCQRTRHKHGLVTSTFLKISAFCRSTLMTHCLSILCGKTFCNTLAGHYSTKLWQEVEEITFAE